MASDPNLRDRVLALFKGGDRREYSLTHIYDLVRPTDKQSLALVLSDLAGEHIIDKVVRVESPETHVGIQEFSSTLDIPEEIHDVYSDKWLTVTPSMLRVIFKTHGAHV